jgi:hypothetical protein
MPHTVGARPSKAKSHDRDEVGVVISLDLARARREAAVSGGRLPKACGHNGHVGTCPACQRAQLARWQSQLAAVAS